MTSTNRSVSWLPALGLLILLAAGSLWKVSQPLPGGAVALIFPPWWPDMRIVQAAAAEGQIVRLGPWHGVVVVRPDASDPGGAHRIAWLRLNPMVAGCGHVG